MGRLSDRNKGKKKRIDDGSVVIQFWLGKVFWCVVMVAFFFLEAGNVGHKLAQLSEKTLTAKTSWPLLIVSAAMTILFGVLGVNYVVSKIVYTKDWLEVRSLFGTERVELKNIMRVCRERVRSVRGSNWKWMVCASDGAVMDLPLPAYTGNDQVQALLDAIRAANPGVEVELNDGD